MSIERHYRVKEMAWLSGYSEAAIRKKLSLREIGYRESGPHYLDPRIRVDEAAR